MAVIVCGDCEASGPIGIGHPRSDTLTQCAAASKWNNRDGRKIDDGQTTEVGQIRAVPAAPSVAREKLPDELLAGFAAMVVGLVEYPPGANLQAQVRALRHLRRSVDELYGPSLCPEMSAEVGGRFAWALRDQVTRRLEELQ